MKGERAQTPKRKERRDTKRERLQYLDFGF
jgi:hypothetical protein